ncbi:CHAD domain-containing protein [Pseudarthrobacter sp. So.54]
MAALDLDTVDPALDLELHEVRKRAKRLRYAAEASAPVFGKRATAQARAAEEIQEILGEHHDSVVTRDLLRQAGHRQPWRQRLHLRAAARPGTTDRR